ncbi:MAG: AAA family ATPase, partial [Thermodesulfobacteriota bacterium]|nr:AAA family ATPase [Thermodesulfobacteriota bacterium]
PMLDLKGLKGLVVIDEIQQYPDLFRALLVLADRHSNPTRFLVLGSASPSLLRQSSETLAGRIYYHHFNGFSMEEVGSTNHNKLWLRGGFPRSYIAPSHADSNEWLKGFIQTFHERDLPQLGFTIRRQHYAVSGPCSRIIMIRPGILQSLHVPSVLPILQYETIWIY